VEKVVGVILFFPPFFFFSPLFFFSFCFSSCLLTGYVGLARNDGEVG